MRVILFAGNDNFLHHDLILAGVLEKGRALGQQLVKSMGRAQNCLLRADIDNRSRG
jgi:hypothetical protein